MNETQTEPLDLLAAEQRVEALLVALADSTEFRRWLLAMPQVLAAAFELRWQTDRSEFDCVVKGLWAFRDSLVLLAASDELPKLPLSLEAIRSIVERFQRVMLRQAQLDTTIQLKSGVNGMHVNGTLPSETSSPGLHSFVEILRDSVLPKLDGEERLLFRLRMAGNAIGSIADFTHKTEKHVRRKFGAILDRLHADHLEAEHDPATNELFSTMFVTCDEAANILFVSPSSLAATLDKEAIHSVVVDRERRIPLKQLLDYKRADKKLRLQALEELTALDQELGLY